MKKTQEIKELFEGYNAVELFIGATTFEFEMRGNDLYFFDPQGKLGNALGAMGDGWVCLNEGTDDGIFTTWARSGNNPSIFTACYAESLDAFKAILAREGVKPDGPIFKKVWGQAVECE